MSPYLVIQFTICIGRFDFVLGKSLKNFFVKIKGENKK